MGRITITPDRLHSLERQFGASTADLGRSLRTVQDATSRVRLNLDDPAVRAAHIGGRAQQHVAELGQLGRRIEGRRDLVGRTVRDGLAADGLVFRPGALGLLAPMFRGGAGAPVLRLPVTPWRFPVPLPEPTFPLVGPLRPGAWHELNRLVDQIRRFDPVRSVGAVGIRAIDATRGVLGRAVDWPSSAGRSLAHTVGDLAGWASQGLTTIGNGLANAFRWGRDKLTPLVREAWSGIWDGVSTILRQTIAELSTTLDQIVNGLLDAVPTAIAAGKVILADRLGILYPAVAWVWNRQLAPALLLDLQFLRLVPFGRFVSGSGDPGGTFTTRPLPSLDGSGSTPAERGRDVVAKQLHLTAKNAGVDDDEIVLVTYDENHHAVILPGVADFDLFKGSPGLDPQSHSPRDTDGVAVGSAASTGIADNRYAQLVVDALRLAGVKKGADLLIVGHSLGADTALDLASDPTFNGGTYHVTHVVAAAYDSQPQFSSVPPGTKVLAIQNNKDIPVLLERLNHQGSNPTEDVAPVPDNVVERAFHGGWSGGGHDPKHYVDYVTKTSSADVVDFFGGIADAGYGGSGAVKSIDVSEY